MSPRTIFYLLLTLIVTGILAEINYACNPPGMLKARFSLLKSNARIFINKTIARIL